MSDIRVCLSFDLLYNQFYFVIFRCTGKFSNAINLVDQELLHKFNISITHFDRPAESTKALVLIAYQIKEAGSIVECLAIVRILYQ